MGFPPDRLLIAVPWTLYCVLGPRWKERRYRSVYGGRFRRYQQGVAYWLPSLGAIVSEVRGR